MNICHGNELILFMVKSSRRFLDCIIFLFQFVMLATTKMEMIVKCALETQSNLHQVMLLTVILTYHVMELQKWRIQSTQLVVRMMIPVF